MTYSANHILRVDLKDEKARITLTVQKYDVEYRDGKTVSEFTYPLSSTFPINAESKSKTMEGKAFCALHLKCSSAMDALINSLKNDVIQTTKSNIW